MELEDLSSETTISEVIAVQHQINGQKHVRFCIGMKNSSVVPGPLLNFNEVLIGEHITPTLDMNIIRCESGLYVGLEAATIQVSISQKKWGLFTRLYTLFTMDYIDWTIIFSHAATLRYW